MMSGRSCPSLLLTVVVFAPLLLLHLFICPAHAAGRRILHQPLVPISWTPPPSEPFFSGTPPQTTNPPALQQPPPPATIAVNVSSTSSRPSGGAGRKVVIGVSVSVTALALLSFSACFLYRRRGRSSDGSEKLVGAGDDGSRQLPPPGRAAVAGGLLYLGTVEPSTRRASQESNGSPYRKLTAGPALEMEHYPSPELHPMPRLTGPQRLEDPPVELSDDESFYTAQRSASVTTSESPRSTVSRISLSTVGTGKEIAACLMDSAPRSWRTSPRARLPNSDPCEVKHAILTPIRAHPPPPPPPPPPPLPPRPPAPPPFLPSGPPQRGIPTPTSAAEAIADQQPPPPSPSPPQSELEAGIKYLAHPGASSLPVPVRPPSRRQWVKPTSSLAEVRIPLAEVGCSLPTQKVVKELEGMGNGDKPKLKPLHWDKVRASSDRAMVWDQLKSSSFQLNEGKFEALFSTSVNPSSKEGNRRSVLPSGKQENRVLDPKKSQNIAILLRALNVTREEVSEALLDGNCEGLGVELLETLIKMAPTKEEELRLKDYAGDISKLGSAERFLKAVLDIPFAFKRIEAMLYRANFDSEVKYLRKSFRCLEEACEELRNSHLFFKLLDAVLKAGNRMNVGTVRGEARAFKLDTLLKLADVKATDGRTTLLHFVVQEIIRSEGAAPDSSSETNPPAFNTVKDNEFKKQGLKMVAGLGKELSNVKKAAGIDSDVLSSYLSKLELGLEKIKMVLQLGRTSSQGKFFEAMKVFLQEAEEEIAKVKAEERTVLAIVKEITEYFHGDTAREEAHPFRIFMVVRDFLLVLDHVCKEVETTQERTIVGSARSFRIATSASLPVLNRFHPRKDQSSDDDSSSS